ncbi:hypothetical protein G7046_g5469 [Stylonectria norvegica]|nr:hypothetical protein G7046_g5469 [Stylonectria norvegica]
MNRTHPNGGAASSSSPQQPHAMLPCQQADAPHHQTPPTSPVRSAPLQNAAMAAPTALAAAAPAAFKSRRRMAENCKEQFIELKLDNWRARATVVLTNQQIDWSQYWETNPQGDCGSKCIKVFDGFDRTWHVPMDETSPLPDSKKAAAEDLERRREALHEFTTNRNNYALLANAITLIEEETRTTCQNEWDGTQYELSGSPLSWNQAKAKYDSNQMVSMIAKTRLLTSKVLPPGYCRINMVELTTSGKLIVRHVGMPSMISPESFCYRLDSMTPPDDEHSRNILEAARKKLSVVAQNGTVEGKFKANEILRELDKPCYQIGAAGSERASWSCKLHVKEPYSLQPGKGPGRMSTWPSIRDKGVFKAMLEGVGAGKHLVVARKIRLRRRWAEIDALDKYLPKTNDEPELTQDQLKILDELLAGQNQETRQQGRQVAQVLKGLEAPTFRLEFADVKYEKPLRPNPKSPKTPRRPRTPDTRQVHFEGDGTSTTKSRYSGINGYQSSSPGTFGISKIANTNSKPESAAQSAPTGFPQIAPEPGFSSNLQWHTSANPSQSVSQPHAVGGGGPPFVAQQQHGQHVYPHQLSQPQPQPQLHPFTCNTPLPSSTTPGLPNFNNINCLPPNNVNQPITYIGLQGPAPGTMAADYQHCGPPPMGLNFQPPVPDTTFGPIPHVYVPRFDGAVYPPGVQVGLPPVQFVPTPACTTVQPAVAPQPPCAHGTYVVAQQPYMVQQPMMGQQPVNVMMNGAPQLAPQPPQHLHVQGVPTVGLAGGAATMSGGVPVFAGNSGHIPEVSGVGRTGGEETLRQAKFAYANRLYEPQDFKPSDDDPSRFYFVREIDGNWTQRNRFSIDHMGGCRWYVTDEGWFYAVRLPD